METVLAANPLESSFSSEPQFLRAEQVRSDCLIVFIHHFGGDKTSLLKHAEMVNGLGYDAYVFNLSHHFKKAFEPGFLKKIFSSIFSQGGLIGIWQREIQDQMNSINRPIIFYSFSSTSLALPKIINNNTSFIRGWICDGGPFFQLLRCFEYFYKRYLKINNPLALSLLLPLTYLSWNGWKLESSTAEQLKRLAGTFPILNLRGCKDPLVPLQAIDDVFKNHPHLNLEIVELKNTGHLNGITIEDELYRNTVKNFLGKVVE